MKPSADHPWPVDLGEARVIQERIRAQVITCDAFGPIRTVAGVDAGYSGDSALAAVVVLAFPSLQALDYAVARRQISFPYVPGYLSFREAPAVLDALASLRITPDLLMCDGHGLAHPRRCGIACHLGVLTDLPSIGCAKSVLVGAHDPLPDVRGAWTPLRHDDEIVGAALRTRPGVRPVYVSVGHRVSLETAIQFVMACVTRYRLPETTRAADALASQGRIPR
ncbi:deoxyribonuclease V [Roseiflexus castenholzii]|jgi:deoxyribonuclease V|uniref:Endonuclease V n=1 Tax=Roseiflexus castenholzii (strain DSM 13941 / HLO8) TaxID=383372 RepID=NFI_ROSCS|nr:deoxyribonuclease V [Roseiflexus castenholzii]A7NSC5.1 RecName: Full=Endonuclease V; AltName: Full=Deoxyinosine 3'endonuclease; AltName: Full=Deoxyribonuclease V; Short=DNase V [Roseiflexus castenholzii DSM 13941]ABU58464.1 Deoxyribonuclease V [Roseiflexus castenholzii DSM 13941]